MKQKKWMYFANRVKHSFVAVGMALLFVSMLVITPLQIGHGQENEPPKLPQKEEPTDEQSPELRDEDAFEQLEEGLDDQNRQDDEPRMDRCARESRGNAHGRRRCPSGSSSGVAKGDFNGDGFADLAVGVPYEDIGNISDAGAVNVIYGSVNGLTSTGSQFWHQQSPGFTCCTLEATDHFGSSLASGDFNGDGYSDLAVGVPYEGIGNIHGAGAVNVIYGTASGLTAAGNQVWHQDSPGIEDVAERLDGFGSTLTWGDFNRDGYGDLAIGVPFKNYFSDDIFSDEDRGAVNVIYGSVDGLRANGNQIWNSENIPIWRSRLIGSALTAGDFNNDSFDDLAVGVPEGGVFDDYNSGAVAILYGSANRITTNGSQAWYQEIIAGDLGVGESGDRFGAALAAGDFNADGYSDLAVGVPGKDRIGIDDAGVVNVLYGAPNGLTEIGNQLWHQGSPGILDTSEDYDQFGSVLAAGKFNLGGYTDLAVGVPQEDITSSRGTFSGAGAVNVIYGSSTGLRSDGNQFWHQDNGLLDVAEDFDQFGRSLTAWNFGNGSYADLAVGVNREGIGFFHTAGAVNVIYGSASGLTNNNNQFWHQGSPGILGDLESGDFFGLAQY